MIFTEPSPGFRVQFRRVAPLSRKGCQEGLGVLMPDAPFLNRLVFVGTFRRSFSVRPILKLKGLGLEGSRIIGIRIIKEIYIDIYKHVSHGPG